LISGVSLRGWHGFHAVFAAIAGGLLAGTLSDRRQEFTLQQAKDILRALGIVETLLMQGKTLFDSWVSATNAVGPAGQIILVDLVTRMRACMSGQEGSAVREWAKSLGQSGRRYCCYGSI
jgi:hypothetical protein